MPTLSWLQWLAKLVPHAGSLDDIAEAIHSFISAESVRDRGEAAKLLIDLLVPILETVTGLSFEDEGQAVAALKIGDGTILKRLKDFYESPAGQALIALLLARLGK